MVRDVRPYRGAAWAGTVITVSTMNEPFPVRVYARLEQPLSRWLWLVKWLLLIPHVIVLALLWLAMVPLTLIAWVGVLAVARYPRWIFGFTVGVMRWTWRVSYYGYSALGTDQYPPFTLSERPDYPARLEVDYPERLSRGLALVKWWLLAIPHYAVLAVLLSGPRTYALEDSQNPRSGIRFEVGGWGLLGLLVLVAAVALLFTRRYPSGIYDLVVGLNRWGWRVFAYVALLTDRYPPFRLDQGATEPDTPPDPHARSASGPAQPAR